MLPCSSWTWLYYNSAVRGNLDIIQCWFQTHAARPCRVSPARTLFLLLLPSPGDVRRYVHFTYIVFFFKLYYFTYFAFTVFLVFNENLLTLDLLLLKITYALHTYAHYILFPYDPNI